jgi:hypothetical protein
MTDEPRVLRNRYVSFMPVMSPRDTDEPRVLRYRYVSFMPVMSPVMTDEAEGVEVQVCQLHACYVARDDR